MTKNLPLKVPQGRGDWYPTHSYMERHHHSQEDVDE